MMPRECAPFGTVLRALRREQGVTQLELALACGASDATYLSRLENGHRSNPSTAFLGRCVQAFAELGHELTAEQRSRLADAALTAAPEIRSVARESSASKAADLDRPRVARVNAEPREFVIRLVVDVGRRRCRVRVANEDDAA